MFLDIRKVGCLVDKVQINFFFFFLNANSILSSDLLINKM